MRDLKFSDLSSDCLKLKQAIIISDCNNNIIVACAGSREEIGAIRKRYQTMDICHIVFDSENYSI